MNAQYYLTYEVKVRVKVEVTAANTEEAALLAEDILYDTTLGNAIESEENFELVKFERRNGDVYFEKGKNNDQFMDPDYPDLCEWMAKHCPDDDIELKNGCVENDFSDFLQ